jgi:glycosidase
MKKLSMLMLSGVLSVSMALPALAQTSSTVVHPGWSKNVAIYEANIRQHSPEGSFRKFEAYLPELQKMGVGIVWLMPINPIGVKNRKGTLGSYYAVRDYQGVNPEFGTPEDFRHLVKAVHARGMRIIIDWVPNHSAWDHAWVTEHPDYYVHDAKGDFVAPHPDWLDVIKLNYANPALRMAMLDAMKFWLREYDIDGFRCDVAADVPTGFWNDARHELDKIKPVFMLAEAEQPDLHEHAFDMTYAWQIKNVFGDIAQGKKTVRDLDAYLAGPEYLYHPDAYRMLHTSNHDLNSWEGTEFVRLGDGVEAFLVLSNLMKGMPLLYSGQEAGNTKALEFFERDPIQWKQHKFKALYTKLFQLKKSNHALWNGSFGGELVRIKTSNDEAIFAFSRSKDGDRVTAVFNLSGKPRTFTAGAALAGQHKDLLSGAPFDSKPDAPITLQPWEYRVYTK